VRAQPRSFLARAVCALTHASFFACAVCALTPYWCVLRASTIQQHINNSNDGHYIIIIIIIIITPPLPPLPPPLQLLPIKNHHWIIFLFISPQNNIIFWFRSACHFFGVGVDYFNFFEPSQQPLWKTKQYDIGIDCLGQLWVAP